MQWPNVQCNNLILIKLLTGMQRLKTGSGIRKGAGPVV